jgi:hypothetical protein
MRIKFVVLALLALLFALPSRADSIDYTLNFDFDPFEIVTFSLPVNPLPTATDSTGFVIQFLSGSLAGSATNFDIGMDATDLLVVLDDFPHLAVVLANLSGSSMPLFSGDPTNPTLLPGSFRFLSGGDGPATLTAKSVSSTSPVPEPASLHLLAAGMLLALFFKFRR